MILFVMCLNPLLPLLVIQLTGIRIGRSGARTTVVAYADDVTLFVTSPCDIPITPDALMRYVVPSGAKVNFTKSADLSLGSWDISIRITDISYHTDPYPPSKDGKWGGWDLINLPVKFHALFLYRMRTEERKSWKITAD
jgi:hypothetical protein